MAIGIHVVRVGFLKVDALGNVIDKEDSSTPLASHLSSSHDHRVIADAAIANSTANPDIKTYLEAEANNDYVLGHISQNMIVTYSAGDLNSA